MNRKGTGAIKMQNSLQENPVAGEGTKLQAIKTDKQLKWKIGQLQMSWCLYIVIDRQEMHKE